MEYPADWGPWDCDPMNRVYSFVIGFFLLIFVVLGYETHQIALLGAILYGLISFFYNVAGFVEGKSIAAPLSLNMAIDFVTFLMIMIALILILMAFFGSGNKSGK